MAHGTKYRRRLVNHHFEGSAPPKSFFNAKFLLQMNMTIELLVQTNLAKEVRKLIKRSKNEGARDLFRFKLTKDITRCASAIVQKWAELISG